MQQEDSPTALGTCPFFKKKGLLVYDSLTLQ